MSFNEFDGKKEVRFGGGKKFNPDPGKYVVEIQDTMETKFNESSGITSLILDMKTVDALGGQDETNLGVGFRVYISDGNQVANKRLKAIIHFSGVSNYFNELYEDVPTMDSEKWPAFMKDVRDKLSFRKLGVELANVKGKTGTAVFTNIMSFFPANAAKAQNKVKVQEEDFNWESE
jgi:hypothetical protein